MIENKKLSIKRRKYSISDIEYFQVGDIASAYLLDLPSSIFYKDSEMLERIDCPFQIPSNYLFNQDYEGFWEIFWIIASEMAQLNDFCVMTIYNSYEIKETLEKQTNLLMLNSKFENGIFEHFSDESENWRNICLEHVWSSCFVLCSAFLERTLKRLCQGLSDNVKIGKKVSSKSDVDYYLTFLHDNCCIVIDENQETQKILKSARGIRNAYVHGDIDQCTILLNEVSLREFLESITNLINQIEKAARILEDNFNS